MNHSNKSPSTETNGLVATPPHEAARTHSGNYPRMPKAQEAHTSQSVPKPMSPTHMGGDPIAPGASAASRSNGTAALPKQMPPRPATSSSKSVARPLRQASVPPPVERTQAYDQRELRRLLSEADPSLASAFDKEQDKEQDKERENESAHDDSKGQRHSGANPVHELPTVRPAGAKPKIAGEDISGVKKHNDTLADEDLTTAYVRQVTGAPLDQAIRAAPVPSDPNMVFGSLDRSSEEEGRDSCSFADLSEELALSEAHPNSVDSEAATKAIVLDPTVLSAASAASAPSAAPVESTTFHEDAALTPLQDEVASERTGPQMRRRSSLKPPQKRRIRSGWLLLGLFTLGAIALAFGARTEMGHAKYAAARTWVVRTSDRLKLAYSRSKEPARTNSVQVSPPARLVDINITVEPTNAQLYLDGRMASNPLRVAYPSDDAIHELRAEAPGYASVARTIRFDRDVTVVLALGSLSKHRTEPTP